MKTGGLAAYFKAYPTVKFINKTIITPQRPPPSAVTPVRDLPKKQIVTSLFGMEKLHIYHRFSHSVEFEKKNPVFFVCNFELFN